MDKTKIRISFFLDSIIDNDAKRFGLIKKDNTPNRNGLINKIIPAILRLRQYRREKIHDVLSDMGKERADEIYESVNQVIDEVYFTNADIRTLDAELWILPTEKTRTVYDEIETIELSIVNLTLSAYLRGLLNEYALLPQFKREEIAFWEEIRIIQDACAEDQIIHFRFAGEDFQFYPFNRMYGFLHDQTNYVIGYDIERKQIRSLPIAGIRRLGAFKRRFHPSDDLTERLEAYLKEYKYSADNIVSLGEDYKDRQ